jgi:hypothetical protein
MATITNLEGTNIISTADSMAKINTNFTNLNNDKIETSFIDTDTALTANSDTKIATQRAVKTYADAVSSPVGKSWNEYAVDAVGTDSYAITLTGFTAYVAGQTFKFKAGTANTGACSLNVNGLGAKTIKKDVSSDLATGDILENQIVTVIYDGTNMQMVNPSVINGATQVSGVIPAANLTVHDTTSGVGNAPSSSSTQTITHSLGRTPKIIRIYGYGDFFISTGSANSNSQPSSSTGTYNSTGNRCTQIDQYLSISGGRARPTNSTSYAIWVGVNGDTASGVIGNVGATTFDIVWTVSGTNVTTGTYLWEAE